jgi:hypothetical protein
VRAQAPPGKQNDGQNEQGASGSDRQFLEVCLHHVNRVANQEHHQSPSRRSISSPDRKFAELTGAKYAKPFRKYQSH